MKCDRCNGIRYIEPRDGKRIECPKCDGSGILFGARLTDPDGRLTTEEFWPGFNYDWNRKLWIESDEAFQARLSDPE